MKTVVSNGDGTGTNVIVEDGNLIAGTVQDCGPILERAKTLHNEGMHGSSEMRLAASVPRVIVERYLVEHGITLGEFGRSPEHQRRFLNDPANAMFRVWPGRV